MARSTRSSLEPLESRIAPASLVVAHALPDITAGVGKTGSVIDLGNMFDANGSYHTLVTFHTNFDSDPNTPGVQGDITMELYDDTAPLTVQNFLSYATNAKTGAGFMGTFFHRMITTSGLDILQGGGYTAANFAHIAGGPVVHNEFGASNTLGTVAMAKVTGDPNSATSEFFINLADNSANLDQQNSGFTVFAKLVPNAVDDSLAVVQKIATLTTANLAPANPASPFNAVPVQNGYSTATGHLPTAAQLITVTKVDVDAPLHGTSPGTQFSVSSDNSNLLTTSLVGDKLTLAYKPGVSGVADVTVHAVNGADSTDDTFHVTVKPNLNVSALTNLPAYIVPGDTGLDTVKLTDNGAVKLSTHVDVLVYLKDIGNEGLAPQLIGQSTNLAVNLASGGSSSIAVKLSIPATLEAQQLEHYQIETKVVPSANTAAPDTLYPGDQTIDRDVHAKVNGFGAFAGRTNVSMSYLDANSHLVTMKLAGGGFGQLFIDATHDNALLLDLTQTSALSALSATVSGGAHTTLAQVDVVQPPTAAAANAIGSVAFGAVDLTGEFLAFGGVKSLALGNLAPLPSDTSSHTIQIGDFSEAPGVKANISLGEVTDYSLLSSQAIGSLTAQAWHNVNSTTEQIEAKFLDSLAVKGDLEANVNILAAGLVKTFTVGGTLHHSEVHIGGNVGAVVLGGMTSSDFLVGTRAIPANRVPTFDATRSIASFIVKGVGNNIGVVDDSSVVASVIGNISFQYVNTADNGTAFGIIANQIASYQRGVTHLTHLSAAGKYDAQTDYSVSVIPFA